MLFFAMSRGNCWILQVAAQTSDEASTLEFYCNLHCDAASGLSFHARQVTIFKKPTDVTAAARVAAAMASGKAEVAVVCSWCF
mmetsp:Transcript_37222/g.109891  ORF Transcript_37222/g.109891 Transcript_37222/m.109891 type:complete len:83 (+) Transcript_37222:4378-4626(+)